MDAVDSGTIASILKSVLSIASGGPTSWIVTGVLGIAAIFIVWWLRKQNRKLTDAANNKKREGHEAETPGESQKGEEKWDEAAEKIEDVRKENPDSGKKPRNPVE